MTDGAPGGSHARTADHGASHPGAIPATELTGAMAPEPRLQGRISRMKDAVTEGNPGVALRIFRELWESPPNRTHLARHCDLTGLIAAADLRDPEALADLIDVALAVDADEAAEQAAHRLLSLRNGDPGAAYYDIARRYFSRARYREALMAASEAHRRNQDADEIAFFLGMTYQHFGWFAAAAGVYGKLTQKDPAHLGAMVNAAVCHSALGDTGLAIGLLEKVLARDAGNEVAAANLIMCLCMAGLTERAQGLLRTVEPHASGSFPAPLLQAFLLERTGRAQEAVELLEPLVATSGCAQLIMVYGRSAKQLEAHLTAGPLGAIRSWKDKAAAHLPVSDARAINFLLGDLHDKRGEYDCAFRCYREANCILAPRFERQPLMDLLRSIQSARNDTVDIEPAGPGRNVIFIVGMPRSGTSLLEQIITLSPHAHGAGERPTIGRIARELSGGNVCAYPSALATLPAEKRLAYAHLYLQQFRHVPPHRWIVDKMPANFRFVGVIAALFPQARIIHMTRDWRDACLSCYCHDFSGRHPYKHRLSDLAFYHRIQEDMMRHWRDTCGASILGVRYEDLILRFDDTVRGIFEFIGIEQPADCRNFFENDTPCLTASYRQVRNPLYTTSIGRWRRYERHLCELYSQP